MALKRSDGVLDYGTSEATGQSSSVQCCTERERPNSGCRWSRLEGLQCWSRTRTVSKYLRCIKHTHADGVVLSGLTLCFCHKSDKNPCQGTDTVTATATPHPPTLLQTSHVTCALCALPDLFHLKEWPVPSRLATHTCTAQFTVVLNRAEPRRSKPVPATVPNSTQFGHPHIPPLPARPSASSVHPHATRSVTTLRMKALQCHGLDSKLLRCLHVEALEP